MIEQISYFGENCFHLIKLKTCGNRSGKGRVKKNKKKLCKITHLLLTHPPHPQLCKKKQKKTCCFLGFLAHFEQKKFWKFFHLENFLTSSMYGLIFMILGHGGSLKGKSGQIFFYYSTADKFLTKKKFEIRLRPKFWRRPPLGWVRQAHEE